MRRHPGPFWPILACAVCLFPAGVAVAAPCSVPGTHPSLASALADPSCDPINLASGVFQAGAAVDRTVAINGAGPNATVLRGVPDGGVLSLTPTAVVTLDGLGLLVHADSFALRAISTESGATVAMTNVAIGTAAPEVPLPPLDDAIALWNFVNPADSRGRESDFSVVGTFTVGTPVSLPPSFAANADGFVAAEGPSGNCSPSFGHLSNVAANHELAQATAGSVSMWARVRMQGYSGVDDVIRFGSLPDAAQGSYELEVATQNARFSVLGAGQPGETAVLHGAVLTPGSWYDLAGVFDGSAQQLRIAVHDPETGLQVGTPMTLAVPFSTLALPPTTWNLLLLEAPFDTNGCNFGAELEGAAAWDRALSPEEVHALSQGPGSIFVDGFESGNTSAWSFVAP